MLDLTRFPVSDEFFPICKTFCTILDRKDFLDFLNYWFSTKGHVTTEHMELWRIRWRIQWEHSQVPVGPPWGPKVPLKVRNTRLGHKSTLFERFRGIMKIGIRKNWSRIWSTSVLGFLHLFEVIRSTAVEP